MPTSVPIVPRSLAIDAPASTMTCVRFLARKAVRRQFQAAGLKLSAVDLVNAAHDYVRDHRAELIAEAIETVRNVPGFRTLAEREARERRRNQRERSAPSTVNRTLRRGPNAEYRPREYLTEAEVDRLIEAARKRGRNGARDACAILLAYRHGLRASELVALQWAQMDLRQGRLHVNRAKGGIESVHPLHGPELRALRPLQGKSPYVFVTEAGTPVTTAWLLRMVQRTGEAAGLPFQVHPHMLRHATGYKLANDGADTRSLAHYLGHRNLQSTARYTALAPDRFKAFWSD